MFIRPEIGTVISWQGRQLFFHSSPPGLHQFEEVETGEIFKWKHEEFAQIAGRGEFTNVPTLSSPTAIAALTAPKPKHRALLIGLTAWEKAELARNACAWGAYHNSGLSLKKDAERVTTIVDQACEAGGFMPVSLRKLSKLNTAIRRCGDKEYAFTPQRRGRPYDAYTIVDRDEMLAKAAIEAHYLVLEQPSAASSYRHYLRLREQDIEINGPIAAMPMSLRTLQRRIERWPSFDKALKRHGKFEARKKHRLVRGIYSDVLPMEEGETDDCYLPILVVNDDYTHALGMPRLCGSIDRGTGYVSGFFLWCSGVTLFSALGMLKNTLSDKAPILEKCGLPLDAWPYTGPYTTLYADRGPNLNAADFVRAGLTCHMDVQFLKKKKAWGKPFIERLHAYVLEEVVKELPGRVFDDVVSFREYNAKVRAVVPISALIRILVRYFVTVINAVPRPGHYLSPKEEMMAFLADHPPPVVCAPDELRIATSMEVKRTLGHEGIRWANLHYRSDELEALVNRIGHGKQIKVLINPSNLHWIYVIDPKTGAQIKCDCTWRYYSKGLSLPEHQLLCRMLNARRRRIRKTH